MLSLVYIYRKENWLGYQHDHICFICMLGNLQHCGMSFFTLTANVVQFYFKGKFYTLILSHMQVLRCWDIATEIVYKTLQRIFCRHVVVEQCKFRIKIFYTERTLQQSGFSCTKSSLDKFFWLFFIVVADGEWCLAWNVISYLHLWPSQLLCQCHKSGQYFCARTDVPWLYSMRWCHMCEVTGRKISHRFPKHNAEKHLRLLLNIACGCKCLGGTFGDTSVKITLILA